ncbi:carbonic anhydrase 6 [Otolemur garnettii]|uniref:carbonic anhydrase 6 n=1 Tax=Otolemur garnettii TaxID=30611 RepID=UPI000C7ECA96|nr:carbonic anhydrase 6 [Otolemur garnettii]
MRALVPLLSLLLLGTQAQHGSEWTYSEGALDQAHWPKEYPACGGKRQSPINLQTRKVHYNPSLKALNLTGYDTQEGEFSMVNNGHTVQISLPPTMHLRAPDGTKYIAQQMHFHWGGGSSEMSGSEHTVDGARHMSEIHVVHYNSKYQSYDIAKDAPNGLAVMAAFIEVKDHTENTYYDDFISHLANIKYAGQSTTLTGLDIKDMLPVDLAHYFSYNGSLTTPPCTENVHWFVMADYVKLSKEQILKLESSLLDHRNKTIRNDYRRTQPLNDRVVEANFLHLPNQECAQLQSYLSKIDKDLQSIKKCNKKKKKVRRVYYY